MLKTLIVGVNHSVAQSVILHNRRLGHSVWPADDVTLTHFRRTKSRASMLVASREFSVESGAQREGVSSLSSSANFFHVPLRFVERFFKCGNTGQAADAVKLWSARTPRFSRHFVAALLLSFVASPFTLPLLFLRVSFHSVFTLSRFGGWSCVLGLSNDDGLRTLPRRLLPLCLPPPPWHSSHSDSFLFAVFRSSFTRRSPPSSLFVRLAGRVALISCTVFFALHPVYAFAPVLQTRSVYAMLVFAAAWQSLPTVFLFFTPGFFRAPSPLTFHRRAGISSSCAFFRRRAAPAERRFFLHFFFLARVSPPHFSSLPGRRDEAEAGVKNGLFAKSA